MENKFITEKPRMSVRCTTVSGWFILIFSVSSYFNFYDIIAFNPYLLASLCLLVMILLAPELIKIVKNKTKIESKFLTLIYSLSGALVLITLLELKDSGKFIWNEIYFTLPITLISILIYAACFIAEDKYLVRIYMSSLTLSPGMARAIASAWRSAAGRMKKAPGCGRPRALMPRNRPHVRLLEEDRP